MKTKSIWILSSVSMLVCFIFVFTMVVSLGEAQARKTFNLRAAAGHPYAKGTYHIESFEEFFCREVEKRVHERTKDYEVKFKGYYGGSLCKLCEALETCERGLADVVLIVICFEPSKLEALAFTQWVPFTTPDIEKMTKAAIRTIDQFSAEIENLERYNQRRLGHAYWLQGSYNPLARFRITKLEDVQNKRLAHGGPMLPWIDALGAVSVKVNFNELFTAMDTGVIDGCPVPAPIATSFKIYEVATDYVKVPLQGANLTGLLTINNKTWKKLPKEVQDIFVETANDYTWDVHRRALIEVDKAYKMMKAAGVRIYELPEKEQARWANRLDDKRVTAKTVAKAEANGWPAEEIVTYYIDALKEEGAEFVYPYHLKP